MQQKTKAKLKQQLVGYSFLIVSIITLLVLTYIPMLTTIKYSFYDSQVLGFGEETFIGWQNYKMIMHNSSFLKSIANTFILSGMSLLAIPLGFILASLINSLRNSRWQDFSALPTTFPISSPA